MTDRLDKINRLCAAAQEFSDAFHEITGHGFRGFLISKDADRSLEHFVKMAHMDSLGYFPTDPRTEVFTVFGVPVTSKIEEVNDE